MKRLMTVMVVMLPLMTSCQSYDWLLYANPPLSGTKEGRQCAHVVFGLGPNVDMSGNQAMQQGSITKVSRVEYHLTSFQGMGKECVVAHGE
ncbi:MAG TPA: TRL domain-containing protein [Nitrospira sp.]|nr:TRL domain-containing protein [Nitrospira sp.]